jgi:hypothetical protein
MIERRCKTANKIMDDNRTFPFSSKLTLLYEMEILSDYFYTHLNWFRRLRNEAAHEPYFRLTADRLDVFAKPEHRDLSNFHKVCFETLIDLWISHATIVGSYLMPFMDQKVEQPPAKIVPCQSILVQLKINPVTVYPIKINQAASVFKKK